jgi:hypothetical protein
VVLDTYGNPSPLAYPSRTVLFFYRIMAGLP